MQSYKNLLAALTSAGSRSKPESLRHPKRVPFYPSRVGHVGTDAPQHTRLHEGADTLWAHQDMKKEQMEMTALVKK